MQYERHLTEDISMLLVTDGLICTGNGFDVHPALMPWRRKLCRSKKRWSECSPLTALEWYALCLGYPHPVSCLLASRCIIPDNTKQLWMVSPYHAVVMRDRVKILPESFTLWGEEDARWLAELINPLTIPEGIRIHAAGTGLVATCDHALEAEPVGFGSICNAYLPDRHPAGKDGGRLMRLAAEIQMLLTQHASDVNAPQENINGVWFWGAASVSDTPAPANWQPVRTNDSVLAGLTDTEEAGLAITDTEYIENIINFDGPPPRFLLLSGSGNALLLDTKSWSPAFRRTWKPGGKMEIEEMVKHACI
ncbi:MAG: hypothetical protein ACE5DY_04450 [Mariprofundaceae bacterium]